MTPFLQLGVPGVLVHALDQAGIQTPTPIQTQAIPLALAGKDVIACAQTGTGKTLAFALPLVARLLVDPAGVAVVLVPTRELASQVLSVLKPILKAAKLHEPCLLIGGVAFGPQIQGLRRNPRVIVATPGRMLDHLQAGKWRVESVQTLVLDEADRMLDMGFAPQVRNILRFLPGNRQTLLFTATLPPNLKQLTKEFLKSPVQVFVDPPSTANNAVEQRMLEVDTDGKQDRLIEELNAKDGSILVFVRTKRRTDRVAIFLKDFGVKVDRIHGDRSQAQRQGAIDSFRSGRIKVLVATDIAARGLDIPQVALVVNLDLPESREDYVHRIGRTGRAGAEGEAVSFVAPDEMKHWTYLSGDGRGKPSLPKREKPQRGGGGGGQRRNGGSRPQSRSQGGEQPRRGFSDSSRGLATAPSAGRSPKPWGYKRESRPAFAAR